MTRLEIRLPTFPECWDSCGNCAQGDVLVSEVRICAGQVLNRDDVVIVLETGKVALDIPSPHTGTVVDVFVTVGVKLTAGQLLCTLDIIS